MADGTFAVAMLLLGLTDMGLNHCGSADGCLGKTSTTPRIMISAGEVLERRAQPAGEVYLRYDLPYKRGPFGEAIGLSIGEQGETWIGFGQTYTMHLGNTPFYGELHAMPGLYFDNGGYDLGGPLEFRSGVELGFETRQGWRMALSYDHRSNAGIYDHNPGIETVALHVSIPTR